MFYQIAAATYTKITVFFMENNNDRVLFIKNMKDLSFGPWTLLLLFSRGLCKIYPNNSFSEHPQGTVYFFFSETLTIFNQKWSL